MIKSAIYTIGMLIVVSLLFRCAPEQPAGEFNWKGTITSSETNCDHIGKDLEGDYNLIVEFGKKDTILLTVARSGNVFKGLRSTTDSSLFFFTANFREDAGIVSEKMQIRLTEPGQGIGSSVWAWTDGMMSCTGSFEFTVEKLTITKPE